MSGSIGDGALGLRVLKGEFASLPSGDREFLVRRYRLPSPRVNLGPALIGVATAAIDISDGLVADLCHLATESGLAVEVDARAIPLSPAARRAVEDRPELLPTLLTGGDDYELLFAAPGALAGQIDSMARALDLPVTEIGTLAQGKGIRIRDPSGRAMRFDSTGWQHF